MDFVETEFKRITAIDREKNHHHTDAAFFAFAPTANPFDLAYAASPCKQGFVWREAANGDVVCVTPAERSDAKAQNANGPNNPERNPALQHAGPNTCRTGYVWRDAFGGDAVCVTPHERSQAAEQNR